MNIVFAGTPAFALPCLDALAASDHRLAAVLTQPDRPAGRGRKLRASPVKQRAEALGVSVQQPDSLKSDAAFETLAALQPDVIVVVAYGLLIPQRVLDLPRYGCINIHPSLLPRWRGAAPVERAVLAGDAATGVAIMQLDAGLDTGPVYTIRKHPIDARITAGELETQLAELGAAATLDVLAELPTGLQPEPQADIGATYAERLTKQEARIDWTRGADDIARNVRGYAPWPVAFTLAGDERIRIWRAHAVADAATALLGTVIGASRDGIDVATGDGVLRVTELQLPGKKRMDAASAVNGRTWSGLRFD